MQLNRPLCQSVLPILTKETGRMHGVILIPNQVFRGDRDVEVSPGKFLKATVVKGFPSSERLSGCICADRFQTVFSSQLSENTGGLQ